MKQLGPYRLLEELGRGGMGVVWRAEDVRSGRIVALKTLLEGMVQDLELVERFRREGELVRGIRHPNLVEVLDQSFQPPVPYVVFEYVAGETLQQRVEREGPLRPLVAAGIVAEVAAGVAAAHERGLLHRDIKPENVLLSPAGAKLSDFGLIKDLDEDSWRQGMTQSGIAVGTPSFMAPEQVDAAKDRFGETTDVYGLAATLYFALTGQPPFNGTSAIAVMLAVREEPPPSPRSWSRDVPAWLDAVCVRGMAKLNGERYPSALALRAALSQGGAGGGAPGKAKLLAGALAVAALALGAAAGIRGVASGGDPADGPSGGADPGVDTPVDPGPDTDPPNATDADPGPGMTAGARADADRALEEILRRASAGDWLAAADELERLVGRYPQHAGAWQSLAKVSLALGRNQRGLEAATRASELDPTSAPAWKLRAEGNAVQGRLDDALECVNRAVELDPSNWDYLLRRVVFLGRLGRKAEAQADFARAERIGRDDTKFYRVRGEAFQDLGGWRDALTDFDLALERGRETPHLRYLRALSLARMDRPAEALADLLRAEELSPRIGDDYPKIHGLRGEVCLTLGDYPGAYTALSQAIEHGTTEAADYVNRAVCSLNLHGTQRRGQMEGDLARALELDPRQANVFVTRGQLRWRVGDFSGALRDFDRAVELKPEYAEGLRGIRKPIEAGRSWVEVSLVESRGLIERKQFDVAEHLLRQVVLDHPENAEGHMLRGVLSGLQGDVSDALAKLTRAVELDPGLVRAIGLRGTYLNGLGRFEEALAEFDRALELGSSEWDPQHLVGCGAAKASLGRFEEALADYRRAIELAPGQARAYSAMGVSLAALGRYEAALEAYDQALARGLDGLSERLQRALAHAHLGQAEAALGEMKRAEELAPDEPRVLTGLGEVLLVLGRVGEALVALDEGIERGPNAAAYSNRATCLLRLYGEERLDDALRDVERALQLDPRLTHGYRTRATIRRIRGEFEAALGDLDRALALRPNVPSLLVDRGSVRAELERYDAALADVERALELDPTLATGLLVRGQIAASQGRYAEAHADFDRAGTLQADWGALELARGEAYERQGQLEKARAALRRALDLGLSSRRTTRAEQALARIEAARPE